MIFDAYLLLVPGSDRPYFCHDYPASYLASPSCAPGSRVFSFRLDVPGFEKVDGVVQLAPTDVVELTERQMAPDHVEGMEFTCPNCGSSNFGSSKLSNGIWERMCGKCYFTFPETDDAKYFKGTGQFLPRVTTATGVP